MKKIAAVLLLSTAVAAPVFAADTGLYAGVTLGRSNTGDVAPGVAMTKSTDTVLGVLGGYQITKNWGAEAFYTGAGKWAATSAGVPASGKADAWGVVAVGTLPLSDTFSLYGKLGYASTKTKANSPTMDLSATRNAATYGLGAQYNVNQAIGIRFGWDRYGAAVNTNVGKVNNNANVYSLGGVFKF